MMVLGTGMGVANAATFELVPNHVPEAVGGASGSIGGIGGAGTLAPSTHAPHTGTATQVI